MSHIKDLGAILQVLKPSDEEARAEVTRCIEESVLSSSVGDGVGGGVYGIMAAVAGVANGVDEGWLTSALFSDEDIAGAHSISLPGDITIVDFANALADNINVDEFNNKEELMLNLRAKVGEATDVVPYVMKEAGIVAAMLEMLYHVNLMQKSIDGFCDMAFMLYKDAVHDALIYITNDESIKNLKVRGSLLDHMESTRQTIEEAYKNGGQRIGSCLAAANVYLMVNVGLVPSEHLERLEMYINDIGVEYNTLFGGMAIKLFSGLLTSFLKESMDNASEQ